VAARGSLWRGGDQLGPARVALARRRSGEPQGARACQATPASAGVSAETMDSMRGKVCLITEGR
jgi:hypothetical protein